MSPALAEPLQSQITRTWAGKQTGPGTPASTAAKSLRQVDGTLAIQRALGSVRYADGRAFANGFDFTDSVVGGGTPVFQAQPGAAAWLIAQAFGQDTYTAPSVGVSPAVHVLTPGNGGGKWLTFWTTVGAGSVAAKQRFADSRIVQMVVNGSQQQKDVRVSAQVLSLDPAVPYATDPVAVDDGEDPFLFTQAAGTFNIDARGAGLITTVSDFTLTVNWALTPYYGDDIRPRAVIAQIGNIELAYTLLLDDQTLPIYNLIHYGTETPATGALPANTIHYGSIDFKLSNGGTLDLERSLRIQGGKIAYRTDVAIAPNVNGGATDMPVGGNARVASDGNFVKITAKNGDAAVYV